MSVNPGDVIKFIRQRDYVFEKIIGSGGTSKTVLLTDDVLDAKFVCKIYDPSNGNDPDDCFNRFKDEIKILYMLSHRNIVRIYNYYLYPVQKKGYILMEYIDGLNLDVYHVLDGSVSFENLFTQIIDGFVYLEKHHILHRDIRAQNFLVDNNGILKIIDFGFGKNVVADNREQASILLNWPVSELPNEISDRVYDHKTDMFFIGKMCKRIVSENQLDNFRYKNILDIMSDIDLNSRPNTFLDIVNMISSDVMDYTQFLQTDKRVYSNLADMLICVLANYTDSEHRFARDIEEIINGLRRVLEESALEDIVQNNSEFVQSFVKSGFSYNNWIEVDVSVIKQFIYMVSNFSPMKKNIVFRNIMARLRTVKTRIDTDASLPFDI